MMVGERPRPHIDGPDGPGCVRFIRYSGLTVLGDAISASSFFCCIYVGVENKMITGSRGEAEGARLDSRNRVGTNGAGVGRGPQPSRPRMKNRGFSFCSRSGAGRSSQRQPSPPDRAPPFEFKFRRTSLRSGG